MIKQKIDPDKLMSQADTQYKAMFEFYKNNPAIAAIDLLNQDLAPFQRRIIKNSLTHAYVLNILSRGSGKTRMEGMLAALEAMFNPKKRIGFLAPSFRASKYAFIEFEAIVQDSPILQACIKKISKQTDMWIAEFHNGAMIFALPLVAESKMSIRGTRLHTALIDEYPHVSPEIIDAVITPMLATQLNPMKNVRRIEKQKKLLAKGLIQEEDLIESTKNRVVGSSSAYFKFNHMYTTICRYVELARKEKEKTGKTDYCVNIFNYKDAPEGFFDDSMIAHAREITPEIIFRMEYLSEFPSDTDGFFKRSLLDSCISHGKNAFMLESKGEQGYKYFLGIDPGGNNDAFALSIVKLVNGEARLVRVISYMKTPLPIIAQDIRALMKDYDFLMIGMDDGGGGFAMRDLLADPMTAELESDIILDMDNEDSSSRVGRKILRMVNFNPKWISEANFDMRTAFEHKKFLLPAVETGDTHIKPLEDSSDIEDTMLAEYISAFNEVQSIVVTSSKSGSLHFDTQSQRMRKDRYSATLIAHKLLYDFIKEGFQQKELAIGGWLGARGLDSPENDNEGWKETKIIDEIRAAQRKRFETFEDSIL